MQILVIFFFCFLENLIRKEYFYKEYLKKK
jgi:hypothetical protein